MVHHPNQIFKKRLSSVVTPLWKSNKHRYSFHLRNLGQTDTGAENDGCNKHLRGTRGKPNEQLFPKQVVIQLTKIYKICY